MVLRRAKKTTLEDFSRVGIARDYVKQVNRLIDLAKGRVDPQVGGWFYSLFLGRTESTAPKTVYQVQELLEKAWWIEEDDLRQELAIYIYENGIHIKARYMVSYKLWLAVTFKIVAIHLKQYIIGRGGQLLNVKRSMDPELYVDHFVDIADYNKSVNFYLPFSILTNRDLELSDFHKYLLYLEGGIGYNIEETQKVLDLGNYLYRSIFYRMRIKLREINDDTTT